MVTVEKLSGQTKYMAVLMYTFGVFVPRKRAQDKCSYADVSVAPDALVLLRIERKGLFGNLCVAFVAFLIFLLFF